MSSIQRFEPTLLSNTVMRLDERNARAQRIIQDYASAHATADVIVGIVGLLPFAAIPALGVAIAAQAPLFYQPMARDLAAVYTVEESSLNKGVEEIRGIVNRELIHTGALDIAAEFGTEFMMQIGHELVMEAGMGVLGSLCVPIIGGLVGASLDYLIANMMTWRVGTMVSMFYQNDGRWLGSQKSTFERAKQLTGGLANSVSEVIDAKKRQRNVRVDLNSLRNRFPEIAQAQLRSLKPMIEMMQLAMNHNQIREALKSKGIPVDLIEKALAMYASASCAAGV